MTTPTTPRRVPEIIDDYARARGERDDRAWAEGAAGRLVLDGASGGATAAALDDALVLVRESGEGPRELYGDPREWAREQRQRWAEEGVDVAAPSQTQWRDVPGMAAIGACGTSLVLGASLAMRAEWRLAWTPGLVLLPLALPLLGLLAQGTYRAATRRHGVELSTVAAGVVVIAGSMATAGVFALGNDHPLWHGSLAWVLVLALGYGLLAALMIAVTPEARRADPQDPADDDSWCAQLTRELRARAGMPEESIRRVVEEARSHARATGTPLADEFGSPRAYAARLGQPRGVRDLRTLGRGLLTLALVAFCLVDSLLGGHVSGWSRWLVAAVAVAVAAPVLVRLGRLAVAWRGARGGR